MFTSIYPFWKVSKGGMGAEIKIQKRNSMKVETEVLLPLIKTWPSLSLTANKKFW